MRVVHLVHAAPFGGAQRLAIDIAAYQRAEGADVSMVLFGREGELALAAAGKAGIPAELIRRGLGAWGALRRHCAGAQVLHLHVPPAWLVPMLPPAQAVVQHLHLQPLVWKYRLSLHRRIDSLFQRLLLNRTDRVIAISEWIESAWRREYGAVLPPVSMIYNGVTVPPHQPRPDEPFTIGITCRLAPVKGVKEFIALAAAVHAQAPDVVFRVAGDGWARQQYERMAAAAGLADAMIFEGFVTDIDAFWSRVHLAAFTAPFEPFGLRLIEPLARGVPIIAYRNGTGSDEIIDRCRGIVALPYGASEALAEAALALREDQARLERMGAEGRADVAAQFSLATMAESIGRAYQETMR